MTTPLTKEQLLQDFDDYLRDSELHMGKVYIHGIEMDSVTILKILNPIAYTCKYNEWLSNEIKIGDLIENEAGDVSYANQCEKDV